MEDRTDRAPPQTTWAKARYLDASALVKIFVDEDHSDRVRDFFRTRSSIAATSICIAETLGVIKAKWVHKRVSEDCYFAATKALLIATWGGKIETDSVDLFTPAGQVAVESLARRHGLDLSDALQVETILRGRYSHLGPNSKTVLVTADARLGRAAAAEGILVWNCCEGDPPDWA